MSSHDGPNITGKSDQKPKSGVIASSCPERSLQ